MKRFNGIPVFLAIVASALLAPRPGVSFPDYRSVAARHQGVDAVVLYDSLVVAVDEAGRVTRRCHRAVMLFTDNAINRYGDPRILYNSATQELRIIKARVHMRDGTPVDTKQNGINRTTPFAFDRTPDYADWQETVVTHVGIEKGCVAELEYAIADAEVSPWFGGVEIFSSEDPVESRVLVVEPPPGTELKSFGVNGAPAAERSGGAWMWTMRDMPGRTPFDGGVWEGDYFPAVCYSTAADWQDEALGDVARRLLEASIPFPAAEKAVRNALEGLSTDEDKIFAVHRLSMDAARGVHAPFALLAASPRPAARIYDTGFASPLDRAVLLASLLRAAGYHPEIVLVSAGRLENFDVPALELFDAALVSVGLKDGVLLLDPNGPYERDASYALAGRSLARLGGASRAETKKPHFVEPPDRGASRSALDIELSPGERGTLSGKGRAVLEGAFSPYYIVRSGKSLEEYIGERVEELFEGTDMVSCNPLSLDSGRAEVEFTFTVGLPEKAKGERVYLSFPKAFDAGVSGIERVRPGRSAVSDAIAIEPCGLSVACSIALPSGWKLVTLPLPASVRNEVGSSTVTVEERADGKRSVRSELLLERDVVPPALYEELRALLSPVFGCVVIEKE